MEAPFRFNNKLVRVRGYLVVNFGYSILTGKGCSGLGIWFAFADGCGPPGLWVIVNGQGKPGGRGPGGKRTPPIPVRLIRDSDYDEFIRYMQISERGERCTEDSSLFVVPDCRTYRVTATLTGRVDSISKTLYAARKNADLRQGTDGKGFGHMGLFDAQLVVQSIENVVAVEN